MLIGASLIQMDPAKVSAVNTFKSVQRFLFFLQVIFFNVSAVAVPVDFPG